MNKAVLILLLISPLSFAQDLNEIEKDLAKDKVVTNLNDKAKGLTLHDAIEEGLRTNNSEVLRSYEFQLNEISYRDAYEDFYYPKLNLTLKTTQDHFAENLYRDNNVNAQSAKTPTGTLGLELEDYTIFNWGKDYLTFLNNKETYQRNKEIYKEQKRELRFQIIAEYFNLSRQNQVVRIYKKQLNHTSFIYRLAKEKLSLRKIRSQEFLQTKALFLEAHKNYNDALFEYYKIQQTLANLLGDELETIYRPLNQLKFKPISLGSNEALRLVLQKSPDILDASKNVKNAERSYQVALKNNLPLPKFSLKLGSYQRAFSSAGYSDDYETFSGSKNLEIAATVNMSWRIFGSGGFFNSHVTETSYYQKRIAEIKLKEAHRSAKVANHLTHSRVLYLENKFQALSKERKNARKAFDKVVDNYIAGKTKFINVDQIFDELVAASIGYEAAKYEHLLEKLTLAKLMGVGDFPGEKFDNLVLK